MMRCDFGLLWEDLASLNFSLVQYEKERTQSRNLNTDLETSSEDFIFSLCSLDIEKYTCCINVLSRPWLALRYPLSLLPPQLYGRRRYAKGLWVEIRTGSFHHGQSILRLREVNLIYYQLTLLLYFLLPSSMGGWEMGVVVSASHAAPAAPSFPRSSSVGSSHRVQS